MDTLGVAGDGLLVGLQDVHGGVFIFAAHFLHARFNVGVDERTAVYRITTNDQTAYFLKLRQGQWQETAVTPPQPTIKP